MFIPKITSKNIDLFEVWVPYWEWEEVSANMWGNAENKKKLLNDEPFTFFLIFSKSLKSKPFCIDNDNNASDAFLKS